MHQPLHSQKSCHQRRHKAGRQHAPHTQSCLTQFPVKPRSKPHLLHAMRRCQSPVTSTPHTPLNPLQASGQTEVNAVAVKLWSNPSPEPFQTPVKASPGSSRAALPKSRHQHTPHTNLLNKTLVEHQSMLFQANSAHTPAKNPVNRLNPWPQTWPSHGQTPVKPSPAAHNAAPPRTPSPARPTRRTRRASGSH